MLNIDGKTIGVIERSCVIAEPSANRGDSINVVNERIRLAKESRASALYSNKKLRHLLNHGDAKPIQISCKI